VKGDETCILRDALARARSGNAPAFAALVRRHQRAVYSLSLRMLSDSHKAEDLAQEVFLQLHRRLALIESDAHLTFWLRKVTTHLAIDRLRQEHRHEAFPLDDDPGIVDERAESDPLLQRNLRDLIAQLPPAARAVVLLRFQEDLDPVEIAETLEMPINTVKSHLRRSLVWLREKFPGESGAGAPAMSGDPAAGDPAADAPAAGAPIE
jgi:RNA polymerase sigma-70 factor (ECF subfamily)